tara:strand:- start:474 stop:647 length:174 start_codon:yes stop_codon:yes gene_type:complete
VKIIIIAVAINKAVAVPSANINPSTITSAKDLFSVKIVFLFFIFLVPVFAGLLLVSK